MSLRSPLGRARGLGAAKEGVGHWWAQRLTAIAMVPLALWFVISVIGLAGADYARLKGWMSSPGNATLMLVTMLTMAYHGQLGLQVVIEDYVHGEAPKYAALVAVKLGAALVAAFLAVSILKVAIGV